MRIKQFFSLLLSLALAAAMLSGCGRDAGPGETSVDPIEHNKIHHVLKDSEFYYLDETEALAPYYEQAAARKEAILNSATEIVKSDTFVPGETYTGTAYYVSPGGDDSNDDLSPETAWQTILRVNDADLQEGDAVFFERGGIYRLTNSCLLLADQVTYSAYGEGAKPVITLAQENLARTECWELWYEGEHGEKIWRYYQKIGEVGGIVFDDTSYAQRIYEWPAPDGWLDVDILPLDPANGIYEEIDPCGPWKVVSTNEYRMVEEQLTEDMTFISRVKYSDISYPFTLAEHNLYGDLYLRCDSGNPGECFEDIEIISRRETDFYGMDGRMLIGEANGYALDNLSFKYFINNPVFGVMIYDGAMIQNCTAEWGGNALLDIVTPEPANGSAWLVSDGFYCVATNTTIRNNYMRHMGNGCTFESSQETPEDMGNYTVEGNLMENCAQGIRVSLWNPDEEGAFDSLILRDNIILNTGIGMNNGNMEQPSAIDLGWESLQYADSIEVSRNVMIGSTSAMLRTPDSATFKMNIHDNVIAQSREGVLWTECAFSETGVVWHMMADAK